MQKLMNAKFFLANSILKKYLTAVCIICKIMFANGQPYLKTMLRLPDTGQSKDYTSTYGEDADYHINNPFYFLNGDGTLTDTVTSMMWQQADGGEMTFENAQLYCDTLTLGGYTDWRLPNCHELFSIFNHDNANPALDTIYFTKTMAEYWWSHQLQANDTNKIWVTNKGGGVGNHPKNETLSAGGTKRFHVRAVRDAVVPLQLQNHFINNGNGTTTDLATDLTWQQIPYPDSITWEQALTLADTLTFAGSTDWRLPNIKELQSINDEQLINPSVNQIWFNGVGANRFWSSTSLPNQTSKAWYLDTQYGITTYDDKTNQLYALCVRGGNVGINIVENIFSQNYMHLFPNPTDGIINIHHYNEIDELRIINPFGKVVYAANPKSRIVSVKINTDGAYLVSINAGGKVFTKRLLVAQ